MAKPRPKTRNILANKLRALMRAADDMTQRELATASGVSQTQIGNIIRGENSPSVEIAEALAKPFGLTGWQLICPHIPDNYKHGAALNKLIVAYVLANDEVRHYLDMIAERERKPSHALPKLEPHRQAQVDA